MTSQTGFDHFSEKKLPDIPVVVLDTETTGLEPGLGHRIIEIGAIRYEGGRPVEEFSTLLNPERPIEAKARQITGISDEKVADAPLFADIRAQLDRLLDGALLVAHNATFDAAFMGLEYSLATPEAEMHTLLLPNPWLCTLRLARRYFHFGRNGLRFVAQNLGVPVARSHRALGDVLTTAEVLWRMAKQLETAYNFVTVGDLLHAQQENIFSPPPIPVPLPDLLAAAVAEKHDLKIIYLGPKKMESDRHISPRYATTHNGVSYLIAFCHLRQQMRTFRVDRILGAERV